MVYADAHVCGLEAYKETTFGEVSQEEVGRNIAPESEIPVGLGRHLPLEDTENSTRTAGEARAPRRVMPGDEPRGLTVTSR
jgi:hypothetical protein